MLWRLRGHNHPFYGFIRQYVLNVTCCADARMICCGLLLRFFLRVANPNDLSLWYGCKIPQQVPSPIPYANLGDSHNDGLMAGHVEVQARLECSRDRLVQESGNRFRNVTNLFLRNVWMDREGEHLTARTLTLGEGAFGVAKLLKNRK